MRGVLAVAYMEARDRAGLLAVALALGLGLVVANAAGPWKASSTELGQATVVLSLVTVLVMSLILGVSMPVRDAATRRLAFYFARPLSPLQIWSGRLIGLMALLVLCAALVPIPASLAGALPEMPAIPRLPMLSIDLLVSGAAVASATLLVAGNALSAALHASVRWLVVGLAASVLVGAGIQRAAQRMLGELAVVETLRALAVLGGVILVIGLVAGWIHVARGRDGRRQGATCLSLFLWGSLGAATAGIEAYSRSVVELTPREIRADFVMASARGSTILVRGAGLKRGNMEVALLVDVASGKFVEVGRHVNEEAAWRSRWRGGSWPLELSLASDDSCMAWTLGTGPALFVAHGGAPPVVRATPRFGELLGSPYLPFDRGERIAILRSDGSRRPTSVEVRSATQGDLAWSAELDEEAREAWLLAADEQGVLLAVNLERPWSAQRMRPDFAFMLELVRMRTDGRREIITRLPGFRGEMYDVDLERGNVLAIARNGATRLVSLTSGNELARFEGLGMDRRQAWLLSAGRVLTAPRRSTDPRVAMPGPPPPSPFRPPGARIDIHAPDGTLERSIPVESAMVVVAGECAPGRVLIGLEIAPDRWAYRIVDVATGESTLLPDGLIPVAPWEMQSHWPRSVRMLRPAASNALRIFRTAESVLLVDPLTLERRVLVGSGR